MLQQKCQSLLMLCKIVCAATPINDQILLGLRWVFFSLGVEECEALCFKL